MLTSLEAKSGHGAVELPGGFIDAGGTIHRVVLLKEMTGVEEDILSGSGPVSVRMSTILENCTLRIGTIEDREQVKNALLSLPVGDRLALVIALRELSLGPDFEMRVKCPAVDCRKEQSYTAKLADIKPKEMDEPERRSFSDELPSGKKIVWEVLTGRDEEQFLSVEKKVGEGIGTKQLLMRVRSVEDENGKAHQINLNGIQLKQSINILKSLSLRDREFIRKRIDECEPDVDREIEFICSSCGMEWKGQLGVGQLGFFFPSVR